MNLTFQKAWPVIAATVALSTGLMAVSESAQAFLITASAGLPTNINPSLLRPPTVITFDGLNGNVQANAPASIGPGSTNNGVNGGATIQSAANGTAKFSNDSLSIGGDGNGTKAGTVNFAFDDGRGMGYLGFLWGSPTADEAISFFSGANLIATFTGAQVTALSGSLTGQTSYFNFFVTKNSEIFNRIALTRITANGNAFAVDNLAYQAIPTPALLPGLLAMGVGVWRKRKATAEAEAEAEA